VKSETTKKPIDTDPGPDLAPEYDFGKGVRGKYVKRFLTGSTAVKKATKRAGHSAQGKRKRG